MRPEPETLRPALGALAWIPLCAALLCLAAVYAFGAAVLSRDLRPLHSAIAFAFQTGDLPEHRTAEPDRRIGAFTYNDCLILTMAANPTEPLLQKVVSPAAIDQRADPEQTDTCLMLRDFVVDGNTSDYASWPYHRYVSAFVPVTALAVAELGLVSWRGILLAANYAAVAALGALGAWRMARARSAGRAADPRDVGAMVACGVYTLFSGLEFYAQNLSIGLAEPVVYAWFAMLAFGRPLEWSQARLVATTAAVFSVITAFEFWTGQIPVAAAAAVGWIGLSIRSPADTRLAASRALLVLVAAGVTIVAMMAAKIAVASAVFGENVLGNFAGQLEVRVGGVSYGPLNLALHLGGRADHIGQGSLVLGLLAGLAAIVAGFAGLVRLARRPAGAMAGAARARAVFLVVSALMIVAWHLVFRNHSSIHSEFMVRTFAWVWTVGFTLLALSVRVRPRGAPALVPERVA